MDCVQGEGGVTALTRPGVMPAHPASPRPPLAHYRNWNRDVSLEAHSILDLEELADVSILWDVRDRAPAVQSWQEADG